MQRYKPSFIASGGTHVISLFVVDHLQLARDSVRAFDGTDSQSHNPEIGVPLGAGDWRLRRTTVRGEQAKSMALASCLERAT